MFKQIMTAIILGLGIFFLAQSLLADGVPEPEDDEDCECHTIGAGAAKMSTLNLLTLVGGR